MDGIGITTCVRESEDWQKWTGIRITTCVRVSEDWQKWTGLGLQHV